MDEQSSDVPINLRKLRILYQHGNTAIIGLIMLSIAVCCFIYFYYQPATNISSMVLAAWLILYLFVSIVRLFGISVFNTMKPTESQLDYWLYAYLCGVLISGLMWGLLFMYLLENIDTENQNFIIFLMEALIAAAVATYASSFIAFLLTGITIMSPTLILFFLSDDPELIVTANLLIIFFLFLIIISKRLTKTIAGYLTMEIDIDKLRYEKNYAAMLNRELEEEIMKRIQTEGILKEEKYKAEALANKLIQITTIDGLTGISNRRRFDEYMQNEWKRSSRVGSPISLILCDIDFYKAFNDTYGHVAGDDVLRRIAKLLEHYARRAGDLAARYGGEEFAIILPDTTSEKARHLAEEIRLAIEDMHIAHKSSTISDYVTVSFGVATMIPTRHISFRTLINMADEALYSAKDKGRNCVVTIDHLHTVHAEI